MLSRDDFAKITDSIRSASASMEARFVNMGGRLGTAVDTIGTLTRTFDRLADELKGENLFGATQALSQIMSRVAALSRVQDDGRTTLGKLAGLTSGIERRVLQIGKAVGNIGMLAINARIEAVKIGSAGIDFAGFTTEIGRTLQLARTSLDLFTGELRGVDGHLRRAVTSQLELAQRQAATIRSVPLRLAASIDAITDRGERAVAAASAVAQKSRQVGQSISNAVMALQIGDITRQRLEHVDYALGVIAVILAPEGGAQRGRQDDWSGLTARQRDALAIECSGLLAAQVLDAADEFDHEVARILASIQDLATDAEAILQLGDAAVGATDDHRGTFIGEVKGQVAEVDALLKGLGAARRDADAVAVSVSEATTRLVGHAGTLWSLEEDIRIMGLNTSLKCGRLGDSGRPLMVIAQELRVYSNQIAVEASAVTAALDGMVSEAGSLSGGDQRETTADIVAVATIMAESVSRLQEAGESLADALATLAHDTEGVAELLRDTAARAVQHEELSASLRSVAANLANATMVADQGDASATAEADRMMELIMGSYTMQRERMVHDRHSPGRPDAAAAVIPKAATRQTTPVEFEDVLF
jgi:hypothetical protein